MPNKEAPSKKPKTIHDLPEGKRFELLVDAVHDYAIYLLDPDGCVVSWNPGAQRLKGYEAAEILGKHFSCFFTDEAIEAGQPEMELRLAQKSGRFEEFGWRVRKDGDLFWANVILTAIRDEQGRLLGFAKITHDQKEQLEQQRLKMARDRAEAADRAKSSFLASMSHELRTPLNAILGFSQLLLVLSEAERRSKEREYLSYIEDSGYKLLKLVENVLDLARIEQGIISVSVEPLRADDVIKQCGAQGRLLAEKREQRLLVEQVASSWSFLGDNLRVNQILMNFITNAVKYGKWAGRIEIGCAKRGDDLVELFVADDGPGIDPADQERIFEPFQRLGFENSAIEGTGVGLSIARQLARLMHGEVGVTSSLGAGSRFWLRLPIAKSNLALSPDPAIDIPELLMKLPSVRILYIEDNPANLLVFSRTISILSKAELRTVSDGGAGILLATQWLPDVVVTDIHLTDLNGFEVLRRLKADPATAQIPVIALSADARGDSIDYGRKAGFSSYLTKPFLIKDLLSALLGALTPDVAAQVVPSPSLPKKGVNGTKDAP